MFTVGDIVLAIAGRDAGRLFVVVGILNEDYVFIADGKSRKADSPKKKKTKHIEIEKKSENDFMQGLNLKDGKFTNAALRKIISGYSNQI